MSSQPAVPCLLLVPGDQEENYKSIFGIATAYADSGLLLNNHAKSLDRMDLVFPAVVCTGFAIELFLKFFISLNNSSKDDPEQKRLGGHKLNDLWGRVNQEHQHLVVSMFRNNSHTPTFNAIETRTKIFNEAFAEIGDSPFLDWRYAYESLQPRLMSHSALTEVLDALGYAANYIMKHDGKLNNFR
jgi:hypothetical protein